MLLLGASGFLGSALLAALDEAGHEVVLGVRDPGRRAARWPGHRLVEADFARDLQAEDWVARLEGIDMVVNAVGILRSSGTQTFERLHVRAPQALFEACARARVSRVVQISALGADAEAGTGYHRSKHEADRFLLALDLPATVLQPSLVYAPHGASARWFTTLATLPLLALPGGGRQCLQPVHLDDLCEAVVRLASGAEAPPVLAVVGPEPLTLRRYLASLRGAMGLGSVPVVPVPRPLARLAAWCAGRLPGSVVSADTLSMLERGNCADAGPLTRLLGHAPRAAADFIAPAQAANVRRDALLRWLLPVLRLGLATMWIVTAIVSIWVYPVADSLELLARTGLHGTAAVVALWGAAALDLVLGVAMLLARRRQWIYLAQAALILGYTALITVFLPEFWIHPYGPVLKNLPILAAIWLLHALDRPERSG